MMKVSCFWLIQQCRACDIKCDPIIYVICILGTVYCILGTVYWVLYTEYRILGTVNVIMNLYAYCSNIGSLPE